MNMFFKQENLQLNLGTFVKLGDLHYPVYPLKMEVNIAVSVLFT